MQNYFARPKLLFIDIVIVVFLVALSYLVFFRHLGDFPLRLWDEGRNAVNAIELTRNNNFIVTYYNGLPDLWNVKPPLHIWIVSLFFRVFGISELSLRLPSAISSTFVVLMIYLFSSKYLKNRWIGLLGSLIILSSMGFPDIHISRTGDYDALLTLFTFLGSIFTFLYLTNFRHKYLYLASLFWTLAVMTKSIAGLLLVPGVLVYLLLSRKLLQTVKQSRFWIVIGFSSLLIATYFILRENLNHGYLKAVLDLDVFGRYQKDVGSGSNNFLYYWQLLADFRFQKWIYFVPVSVFAIFLSKDKFTKHFILYSFLQVVIYFLIISTSQTKQFWYDSQLYPLCSLLVSVFIVSIINRLPHVVKIFPIIILCFYLQRYIRTNIAYIGRPDLDKQNACIKYGYLYRNSSVNKSGFIWVHPDVSCSNFQFYAEASNSITKNISGLESGDQVLTCDTSTITSLKQTRRATPLFTIDNGCTGLQIN